MPQFVRVAHNAILVESSLAFLGLGDPIQKSWGSILFHANARTAFLTDAWLWWIVPPGLLIALTVLALALIGHGVGERPGEGSDAATPTEGARPSRRTDAALEIADARVAYGRAVAVDGMSLAVPKGTTLGLVGESGSGKSTLAMAVLRLLPPGARITNGAFHVGPHDMASLPPRTLPAHRGRTVALVPQSAMNALNPVHTIGRQINEVLRTHGAAAAARARTAELLAAVGLPAERARAYPHELSGGMRQRAVIAVALAGEPDVLIADEPTTGLDVLVQAEIMTLIANARDRLGMAMLLVSHDLPLVAVTAERIAICQAGRLVEEGPPQALAAAPKHPHTRALFDNTPSLRARKAWSRPLASGAPILELENVSLTYGRGWLGRGASVRAVAGVNLTVRAGEVVGLVGGSGSGKTSLARLALGLLAPDAGTVRLDGSPPRSGRVAHMVFQDPYQSMRPGARVADVVAEPMRIAGTMEPARVTEALAAVSLPSDPTFAARSLASLSGGQRQRVAFARALVTRPRLIVADESTSMLDQSLRAGLLSLMEGLRAQGVAFLFITHDLALARHFADRIAVMKDGALVEEGSADTVALSPTHPYTAALMKAAEIL